MQINATFTMHKLFSAAAQDMHFGDNLLASMLEEHARLSATNTLNTDELIDCYSGEYENDLDLMQGDEDRASKLMGHANLLHAIDCYNDDDTQRALHYLFLAIMQRMFACETLYN